MDSSRIADDGPPATPLAPSDAALFETFVVPHYLRHFGELALEMLAAPQNAGDAIVAHLGCRTGYPDRQLVDRLGPIRLVGADPSPPALELARAKAAAVGDLSADYRQLDTFPSPLPDRSFSHALVLHPPGRAASRRSFVLDAARVLVPGGQLVLSLPLRGSFVEVMDLIREHAVKFDLQGVSDAIEAAAIVRPTPEALGEELETIGFSDVDVEMTSIALPFASGRDLMEDPATRLLLLPEWRGNLGLEEHAADACFRYVQDAIDRYWAGGGFELSVNVGCARGFLG